MHPHTGFLTIPRSGESSEAVQLLRKVHLLAIRMLSAADVPWLRPMLESRPEEVIDVVASPDVLPFILTRDFASAVRNLENGPRAGIPLTGRVELALHDTNPLAHVEAHPDKSGNALDLGGKSIEEWRIAIAGALELIETTIPTWFDEFGRVMRRLVPVGFDPEHHLSASYREAPGIAYLSLHPDPLTMAEAIVHETQHTKLNLALWLDPVLHNGESCWTPSPVRPDLRPLSGVLLAVHAFVPVSVMHRRLVEIGHPIAREPRFEQRRSDVLAKNANALAVVLQHAHPTALGTRVLTALSETLAALEAQPAESLLHLPG